MYTIECEQLTKKYGDAYALQNVTFKLEANTFYGLLGRNGAGKTTLLEILHAEQLPTSGKLRVNGQGVFENSAVLQNICFVKESHNFKQNMKIAEVCDLASSFYPNWDEQLAKKLLHDFQLQGKMKVKHLSKGMGSALGVTIGIASRSPITVFDEPYIGMDAVARQHFYDQLLQDYIAHPRTIILSTHLIDEVSGLFEKVLMIDRGQILLHREVETLKEQAYYVSGSKQNVDDFVQGKNVIFTESFGQQYTYGVFGELTLEEERKGKALGLNFDNIPIQKLMVYLTTQPKQESGDAS